MDVQRVLYALDDNFLVERIVINVLRLDAPGSKAVGCRLLKRRIVGKVGI